MNPKDRTIRSAKLAELKKDKKMKKEAMYKLNQVIEQDIKQILEFAQKRANFKKRKVIFPEDIEIGIETHKLSYILETIPYIKDKLNESFDLILKDFKKKFGDDKDG